MKRSLLAITCLCLAWNISAAVSATQKGENIILKNNFMEVEIAPDGGRICRLVNKVNGVNMVTDRLEKSTRGGARDRVLPAFMHFIYTKHKLLIIKNTPQEVQVQTFLRGIEPYKFVELTKVYITTSITHTK